MWLLEKISDTNNPEIRKTALLAKYWKAFSCYLYGVPNKNQDWRMKDLKKQSKLGKSNAKAEVGSPKTLKAFSSKISDMSLLNKITLTASNTIIKKQLSTEV